MMQIFPQSGIKTSMDKFEDRLPKQMSLFSTCFKKMIIGTKESHNGIIIVK
ncbi:MAG: hypothetical protein PF574_06590 [Candidatus Delongbacteria bacterium]|nr:hypothetical protein [Candidatus Delongbacteria bacterium]